MLPISFEAHGPLLKPLILISLWTTLASASNMVTRRNNVTKSGHIPLLLKLLHISYIVREKTAFTPRLPSRRCHSAWEQKKQIKKNKTKRILSCPCITVEMKIKGILENGKAKRNKTVFRWLSLSQITPKNILKCFNKFMQWNVWTEGDKGNAREIFLMRTERVG